MDVMDPDDLEFENLEFEDLVERYLPNRVPALTWEDRLGWYVWGSIAGLVVAANLLVMMEGILPAGLPDSLFIAAVLAAVWAGVEVLLRRGVVRKRSGLESAAASGELLPGITRHFRAEIEGYRRRTLGPDSEWARARSPLVDAKDEANRSVAYWRERADHGGDPEVALVQARLAETLESKFDRAVAEIDGRADALRAFFNRCEARLSRLESIHRDRAESERLARLSERAEIEVAQAQEVLDRIGADFVQEALRVGSALSGLQRLRLLEEAGRLDLSELERVAEEIVAVSAADRLELTELEARLLGP